MYNKLGIVPFGEHLLRTGDLDPLYIALANSLGDVPRQQVHRFLVAYWCYYHVGAACYLSEYEAGAFWFRMALAAKNESPAPVGGRWPRGKERRHFRGQQAIHGVACLEGQYANPGEMVRYIAQDGGDFKTVSARVQEHKYFGPWMAFKVCDMLERVLQIPIQFDQAAVFMFDSPTKVALTLAGSVEEATAKLKHDFRNHKAPPWGDRPVDLQEVETILCKWGSHLNGHYPLNNDIIEINHGIEAWQKVSPFAQTLLKHMPKV